MATPTVAAMRRCGSRVAPSDMTTKVTCPGSSRLAPCARDRIRQPGGKMLDTRTRLQAAIPAERSANSNEVSFSLCFPTPLVKNISFGTNPTTSRSSGWLEGNQNGNTNLAGVKEHVRHNKREQSIHARVYKVDLMTEIAPAPVPAEAAPKGLFSR